MLFASLFLSFLYFVNSVSTPETITELKTDYYLGHWFQTYTSPTNYIFQGYGTCITADYGLLDNGYISVLNKQLDKNNQSEQINGYAYYKNISEPGKLSVHLDGVPVDGPYWIIKLGEIQNNQYQYSVITSPSGVSLWVLVRNISDFFKFYDTEVINFLDEYNFKYTEVYQSNCNY